MTSNSDIIRQFVADWSTLDAEKLADYFTEDGSYFNIPSQPVTGRDAVAAFIKGFTANWTETQWDIVAMAESGDTVFCERLDRTKTTAGDVDLPCNGVFVMQDGKIKEWRDYFDLNTFMKAMS